MWETQAGKLATSKKMNVEICLPYFSVTKIIPWKWYVDEYTNGRYDMIIDRDLLTVLELDLKFSKNVIYGEEGPYERW